MDLARRGALKRLTLAGDVLKSLSICDQTILAVSSAQGVIDNGGFQHFFEGDWPDKPPYSYFSDAYRRIGAEGAAQCIDRAAALFPFAQPERHGKRRQRFLKSLPEAHELFVLGDRVCGDVEVWSLLETYVRDHAGH